MDLIEHGALPMVLRAPGAGSRTPRAQSVASAFCQTLKGEGAPGRRDMAGGAGIAAGEHVAHDVMFGYPAVEIDGFTSLATRPRSRN